MIIKFKSLIVIFILIVVVTFSQTLQDSTAKKDSIDQLNWFSGYWIAEINGTKMEECWLPENNNSMIGLHRDSFKSGKIFYEYLRIEQIGDSIIYFASPKGRKPTKFLLVSIEHHKVIFENPDHDFPQKIIYTLNSDTLTARIEGKVNGDFKFSEWHWLKSKMHK